MGTRGLIGHRLGGKLHAVYNARDSYPSYLGGEVASYISEMNAENKWDELRNSLRGLVYVSPRDITWDKVCDMGDALQYYHDIIGGMHRYYPDNSEFLNDSLFCEWAYILNLDENKLEVYKGFQRKRVPVSEVGHAPKDDVEWPVYGRKRKWAYGYGPCKMIKSVPFSEIKRVTKTLMIKLYGRKQA